MVKLVWHTGRTSIFFLSTRSLMPRYYAYKKGTSVEHLTPKSTSRIVRCWKEQTRASNTSHLNIFSRALFKNRNSSRPHDSKIVLFPAKGSSNEREREREKKKEGIKVKRRQQLLTSQPDEPNPVISFDVSVRISPIERIEFKKFFQIFIFLVHENAVSGTKKETKKNRRAIDGKLEQSRFTRRLTRLDYVRKQTRSRVTYIRISKQLDSIERGLRNERLMDT